jgi:hypothetical protein
MDGLSAVMGDDGGGWWGGSWPAGQSRHPYSGAKWLYVINTYIKHSSNYFDNQDAAKYITK